MSLDLNAAKTVVENNLRGKGLTVESEIKDNRLHCNVNDTTIKDYKSDVLITVIINQNGVSTFRCVFDKIYNLEGAARAINAFNDYSLWFKAYVGTGENPFLYVDSVCYDISNTNVLNYWLDDMIKFLLDDKLDGYLRPIVNITQ